MKSDRINRIPELMAIAIGIVGLVLAGSPRSICANESPTDPKSEARTSAKDIQIQFRWAESKAIEGLTETEGVELPETKIRVFLHSKPILTNSEISGAEIQKVGQPQSDYYIINVTLTKAGAARLANSSARNLNKPLFTLADGKLISVLIAKDKLSAIPITGPFTKTEAERIVAGIITRPQGEPQLPGTIAERLNMKLDVSFSRTPLQEAFAFIGNEIETTIEIDGNALKAGGYTKNMPQYDDRKQITAADAIAKLLERYQSPKNPSQTMVIVVDEEQKKIIVTTEAVCIEKKLPSFDVFKK